MVLNRASRLWGVPESDSAESKLPNAPKFQTDRSHYRVALERWMQRAFPSRDGLTVVDIEVPVSTGFSNETVILDAAWTEGGSDLQERYAVRIEPADGGMFPPQTPHCEVSVELQYRAMKAVAEAGCGPGPAALRLRARPSGAGRALLRDGLR